MTQQSSLRPPPSDISPSAYLRHAPEVRQMLDKILGSGDRSISLSIGSLLRDPSHSEENISLIEDVYELLTAKNHPNLDWLTGALGFVLFSYAAEETNPRTAPDQYLQSSLVRAFVIAEYGITSAVSPTWTLHRIGTTSYIIRVSNGHPKALKLIKPRYFDRRDIALDTANYKYIFSKYQGASPPVYDCGQRFIIMDFIEGSTLGYYLAKVIPDIKGSERILVTRNIISKLCFVLYKFHQEHINHFDLSPDNIILTQTDDLATAQPSADFIWLIDFGPNHVLREGIGSTSDFEEIRSYVAPEVINDYRAGTNLSDAYSIGRIFLQLLIGDGKHTDISHLLDRAWKNQPQLASLIEELIDDNPSNRMIAGGQEDATLDKLGARITMELQLQENIQHIADKNSVLRGAFAAVGGLTGTKDILLEMNETIKALHSQDKDRWSDITRLKYYCHATRFVFLAVFATFGFVAIGYHQWAEVREHLFNIKALDRSVYLPGLLVGISFSLLASKYYLNIFSRISTRASFNYAPVARLAKRADRWMRINSCLFAFFTIGGMLVSSRAWPIYCGFGVWGVALNNHFAVKLAEAAQTETDKKLSLPPSHEQYFFSEFSKWGSGMMLYGFILMGMWVLLVLFPGLPRDQWIFAAFVVAINTNMLRRNCSRMAPLVRGGLFRLFQRLGRVARIEALKQAPRAQS